MFVEHNNALLLHNGTAAPSFCHSSSQMVLPRVPSLSPDVSSALYQQSIEDRLTEFAKTPLSSKIAVWISLVALFALTKYL